MVIYSAVSILMMDSIRGGGNMMTEEDGRLKYASFTSADGVLHSK